MDFKIITVTSYAYMEKSCKMSTSRIILIKNVHIFHKKCPQFSDKKCHTTPIYVNSSI